MIALRALTRALGLMVVVALSLVVSADSSAAPCSGAECLPEPPQPHALVCPSEKALSPAGPTREERPSPKVGKIPDSFSVSSTGEAVYSLSLNVPPGRLGMEPHLALSYNSGSGEGPFGMGFGLSGLSSITRCASNMAQDHRIRGVRYDSEDNFCLDGLRLVPVPLTSIHTVFGAPTGEYRTFPDTFRRVQAFAPSGADKGPEFFIVETKSGRTLEYGHDDPNLAPNGRVMGKDGLVRSWAITLEKDRHSNTIAYSYRNTREVPGDGHTIVHLPERIDYTGNVVGGVDPTHAVVLSPFYSIWHASAFTGGMATNHGQRIEKIQMLGPGDVPVRTYNLTYSVSTNNRFRLETVKECAGASLTDCRPPTRLDWLDHPGNGFTEIDTGIAYPTHPAGHGYTEKTPSSMDDTELGVTTIGYPLDELDPSYKWLMADVTGDGLSDLVVAQADTIACPVPFLPIGGIIWPSVFGDVENPGCAVGNWNVATNLGGALSGLNTWRQTALPDTFESNAYASFGHQAFDVVPVDLNHDGKTDILYYDSGASGQSSAVRVLTNPAQTNASAFFEGAPTAIAVGASQSGTMFSGSGVLYADMNGDGVLDAITCEEGPPFAIGDHSVGTWQLHLWNKDSKNYALDPADLQSGIIPIDSNRGCYLRNYIHVVDVDGDGKAELLIPPFGYPREESKTHDGHYHQLPPQCAAPCEYQAIQRDHDPVQRNVVMWRQYNTKLPAPDWSAGAERVLFIDVNADGLPDALISRAAFQNRFWTFLNTGDGFEPLPFSSLPLSFAATQAAYFDFAATLDYDGDGQTDILLPMKDPMCNVYQMETCWVVLRSDPDEQGHFLPIPLNILFTDEIDTMMALGQPSIGHNEHYKPFWKTLIPRVADLNGDGRQDVVIPINGTFKLFLNEGPVNLLRAVTDGMNPLLTDDVNAPPEPGLVPNIAIEYGSLVDHATTVGFAQDAYESENDTYLPRSNIAQPLTDCEYPHPCVVGPRRIVKSYELNNGQNQPRKFSMRYRNGRSHRLGRGFLGFGTVITTDEDGHAGRADFYDNVTMDESVLNRSADPNHPFPIVTFPNVARVANSASWVLGLPEDPVHPSLPMTRMHFVKSGASRNFSTSKPTLLVPTNGNTTYFTLSEQTTTTDVEAVYLAADAYKAVPDFVAYYGAGLTYDDGTPVPYHVGYDNPGYKVLETITTSEVDKYDPDSGDVLETSSKTTGIDDIRTVSRKVDNDTSAWRLGEVTNETVCSKVVPLQSSRRCVATDRKYDGSGEVYTETTSGGDPDVSMPLPLQATTTYARDLFGNLTNVTAYDHVDGHQRAACVGYDSDGMFPVVFGNGAEHFTYVAYDKLLSAPIVVEDPNGLKTSWMHDSFGRTVRETRPDGTTTASLIERLPDGGPDGTWWTLHTGTIAPMLGVGGSDLDSLGRTVRSWTIGPAGSGAACYESDVTTVCSAGATIEQTVSYDFLGRQTSRSTSHVKGDVDGASRATTYEYDNLGRVLSVETPWKAKTKYSYAGNSVTVTAPGTSSTTVSDAWGRPTTIVDGLANETKYEYAYFGGLRFVRPPGNTPIKTERDAFGRVVTETDPDRGVTNIVYDGFGERIGLTDGEHTESYDYDVLGRMVVKTDEVGQTIWHYDNPLKGLGRLSDVVNPAGITKSYTYQALGQPGVGQVHTVQLTAGPDSLTTTLDYDASGRLATITSPPALGQQFQVSREYDVFGHLLSVKDALNPMSRPYWELKAINGVGQTTEESMNGGTLHTTRSYDRAKNTLEHILTTVNMTTKVQDLGYTYDDRLNMKSRVDGLQIVAGMPLGEHFEHDALDRLTCSRLDTSCNLGPGVTCPCNQAVKYNDNGNIDMKSGAGEYTYDPAHPHAVQFVDQDEYGYDNVGNQTTRPGLTIAYTPFDLPSKYTDHEGVDTLLEYDGDQTRVRKTVKNDETLYFGDYERVTHLGAVEHRYSVRSDERVVAVVTRKSQDPMGSPGTRAFVHVDHLGSTEKVTDAAGTILERRSYDAFGAKRNPDWTSTAAPLASTTTAGYTGHEGDEALGLVNMKGRIYDPRIARFLTTDPLVSHPGFSQSWNPYSYVMNSPLKFVDPTGFGPNDPVEMRVVPHQPGEDLALDEVRPAKEFPRDPSAEYRPGSDRVEDRPGNKDSGAPQADAVVKNETSAALFAAIRGNKFNPFSDPGRHEEDAFGSERAPPDPLEPYQPALGKAAIGFVPGLNSYVTMRDPKASTLQKVAAVGLDALVIGGAVLKGVSTAVTTSRALVAADLGLEGTDAIVQGTIRIKDGRALVKVAYLGSPTGLGRAGRSVLPSLRATAAAEGATALRIETTPIIESTGRLLKVLEKMGFQQRANGSMFFEGAL